MQVWGCRTFQTASYVHVKHIWEVWAPSQVVDRHMASHWHHYHHRCFPRFGEVGWNPTSCKCAIHATMLWLRIEAVEPFKLHPMSMSNIYELFQYCLRFWVGIWLHRHTVTTIDASPDLERLAEILPDASAQTMPLCFDWGCVTFQTASHVHAIHKWCVWAPSEVVDGNMASHSHRTTTDASPDLGKLVKFHLMQVCKPCHYTLFEAVEPFTQHPISMSYIYERFDCLLRLLMGIWLHTHTVTTTDTSPDLWELG